MRASQIWESPVLQSVLPVVDAPRHVRISEESIRQVANWMAYEEFTPIGGGGVGPFDVGPDPSRITNLTMLVNTLNFAFTDFATSVKFETEYHGTTYVDSEAMVACMHRAITAGEPLLTGEWA
ncbi:MAG: queuosine salvage family protein, partial [Candidatus Limnocylindrus sp.]